MKVQGYSIVFHMDMLNFLVHPVGEYRNGQMDGFGRLKETNGRIYEGQFKQGYIHGNGTDTYAGNTWIGEFVWGYMTGENRFSKFYFFFAQNIRLFC